MRNEKTEDDDMVVYKSSTSLSGLCKSDGYLKCGTLVKREGCVRDVPKSEHDIFLCPETIDYKDDASEDEGDMSEMNTSLSLLCNSKQQQHYDNCIIKLPPYNTLT